MRPTITFLCAKLYTALRWINSLSLFKRKWRDICPEMKNVNDEQQPRLLYDFSCVYKCSDLLNYLLTYFVWWGLAVLCLKAVKNLRTMQLDVTVPDGHIISVNVDSASTSSEICEMIASKLNVKDSFGFSLLITFDQEVRDARFASSCNWSRRPITSYAQLLCFLDTCSRVIKDYYCKTHPALRSNGPNGPNGDSKM